MSWIGKSQRLGRPRSGIITVLDVGSSKVCCAIARLEAGAESDVLRGRTHRIRVIGIGHQRSEGVKSGVIIDLARAERSIRLAVDAAERMAGLTVESLLVNLSAGRLKSERLSQTVNLGGREVNAGDIRRVLAAGSAQAFSNDREVVHAIPASYSLDNERGIDDPTGMIGEKLGVEMHVLTADSVPLRNLELCVNRTHISVERMVATAYASGLAALVEDESEMGAVCIDMGGGTTSLALFEQGSFVHADSIPIGGRHVTLDLARGLSIGFEDAERLKVMHGSALPVSGGDEDMVTVRPIGEEESEPARHVPRSTMSRIIRARVEETLELLRDRLQRAGMVPGQRIVLTGGACQLVGMADAARRILGRNVRVGRPLGVAGLPGAAKGPAFAAVVGLMIYPQVADMEGRRGSRLGWAMRMTGTGRWQRVGQWFRDSF